ncbi:tail sheath stabilizer [Vibrio phage EniLVp02]
MQNGGFYYNKSIRRYITLIQELFSRIAVKRGDKLIPVPVTYASKERFIAKLQSLEMNDDNRARVQTVLPRMSLQLSNLLYDGQRHTSQGNKINRRVDPSQTDRPKLNSQFNPAPYDMYFDLGIWTRHQDDMFQIIEQILPYFQPAFVCKIKELDENEVVIDNRSIPITIEAISPEEDLSGDPGELRRLEWTLTIKVKGWLYPPTINQFGEIRTIYLNFNDVESELVIIHAEREQVRSWGQVEYGIRKTVSNQSQFRYNGILSAQTQFQYSTREQIRQTSTFRYHTHEQVSQQVTFDYTMTGGVSQQAQFGYNVINNVSGQVSFDYSIRLPVNDAVSFDYSTSQTISNTTPFEYSTQAVVSSSITFDYGTQSEVASQTNFQYSITG